MLPQVLRLSDPAKEEPRFLHDISMHDQKTKRDQKRIMTLSMRLRMAGDIRFSLFKGIRKGSLAQQINIEPMTNEGEDIKK